MRSKTSALEWCVRVQFNDEPDNCFNTIAEIPGTDPMLKDEIVMVGAHMDSWHSGTGATDNGAGVAAAMEAMRILAALKLQPRRTIRIGLWSGEEQGLLGSRAYVSNHLGYYVSGRALSNAPSAALSGSNASGDSSESPSTNRPPRRRLVRQPE